MIFMLWIFLSILAALLWTIVNIIDKYIISEVRDPILATVISGISTFLLFEIASLSFGDIFLNYYTVLISILAGVVYNLAVWLYYSAMNKEEVSRIIPIISTTPIFVLIFGFIFLGEKFALTTYLGVILIVVGAVLISIKKTYKIEFSTAFLIAISAAIFFSLRNVLIKFATLQASIWSIFFWVGVGGGITSVFLFSLHRPHIRKKDKSKIKYLLLVGGLTAIGFFVFTLAVSVGPVSLVSALVETQPLFVFLSATILSVFYPKILKEKITKIIILQKMVAITMIIIGCILIV